MTDPTTPTRLLYYDKQFLRVEDFQAEQDYHLHQRREHNRLLHKWGVAEGLEVESASATQVTVKPGTAFDSEGQEVVLASPKPVDIGTLPGYVTIAYAQETTTDPSRISEQPVPRYLPGTTLPAAPVIALAAIASQSGGGFSIDGSVRPLAGIDAPAIRLASPSVQPDSWPTLECPAPNTVRVDGDLDVSGSLSVSGGTPFAVWSKVYKVPTITKGTAGTTKIPFSDVTISGGRPFVEIYAVTAALAGFSTDTGDGVLGDSSQILFNGSGFLWVEVDHFNQPGDSSGDLAVLNAYCSEDDAGGTYNDNAVWAVVTVFGRT